MPQGGTLQDFIQLADDIATFNPVWEGIFEEATAALQRFSQGITNTGQVLGGFGAKLQGTGQSTQNLGTNVQNLHKRMDGMGGSVDGLHKRMDGMGKAFGVVNTRMDGMTAAITGVHNRIGGLGKGLGGIHTRLDGVTGAVQGLHNRFNKMDQSMGSSGGLAKAAIALYVLGKAMGSVISTVIEFEYQMARAGGISNSVGEEFKKLSEFAREMGETTIFTASQSAAAMTSLARLGLKSGEIISVLPDVLNVAAAEGLELNHAARIVGTSLNAFSIHVQNAARVTNTLAAASMSSAAEMADFSVAFRSVGAFAAQANLTIEQTVAALGKLADAGLTPYRSGNALRELIKQMQNLEEQGAELELDRIGLTMDDINPKVHGFSKALQTLNENLLHFGGDINKIFKTRASQAFTILMEDGVDSLDAYTDSITGTNAASVLAERQLDTLYGSVRLLASAFQELQISIGEDLTPLVRGLVEVMTALVRGFLAIPDGIRGAIVNILAFSGIIVGVFKAAQALVAVFGVLKAGSVLAFTGMLAALGPVGLAIAGIIAAIVVLTAGIAALGVISRRNARKKREELETEVKMYDQLEGKLRQQRDLIEDTRFTEGQQEEIKELVSDVEDLNVQFSEAGDYVRTTREEMDRLVDALRQGGASLAILEKFEDLQNMEGAKFFGLEEQVHLKNYASGVLNIELQFDSLGKVVIDTAEKLEAFLAVWNAIKDDSREGQLSLRGMDIEDMRGQREKEIEAMMDVIGVGGQRPTAIKGAYGAMSYDVGGRRTMNKAEFDNALRNYQELVDSDFREILESADINRISDFISELPEKQQESALAIADRLMKLNVALSAAEKARDALASPSVEGQAPGSAREMGEEIQGFDTMLNRVRDDLESAELAAKEARLESGGEVDSGFRIEWYEKEIEALKQLLTHSKATEKQLQDLRDMITFVNIRRYEELNKMREEEERERKKAGKAREEEEKKSEEERLALSSRIAAYLKDDMDFMAEGISGGSPESLERLREFFDEMRATVSADAELSGPDRESLQKELDNIFDEIDKEIVEYQKGMAEVLREEFRLYLEAGGTFNRGVQLYGAEISAIGDEWEKLADELKTYGNELSAMEFEERFEKFDNAIQSVASGLSSLSEFDLRERLKSFLEMKDAAEMFGMSSDTFMSTYEEIFKGLAIAFDKAGVEAYGKYGEMMKDIAQEEWEKAGGARPGGDLLPPEPGSREDKLSRLSQMSPGDEGYDDLVRDVGLDVTDDEPAASRRGRRERGPNADIGVSRRTYYREMPTDFRKAIEATKRQFQGFADWLETDAGGIFSTSLNVLDRFDFTKVFNGLTDGIEGLGDDFDYAKIVLADFTDKMQQSAAVTELFGQIGKKISVDMEGAFASVAGVLSGVPGALQSGQGAGGALFSILGGGIGGAAGFLGSGGAFSAQGAAFGAALSSSLYGAITDRDKLNEDAADARTHDGRQRPQGAQLTHQEVIVYIDRFQNDFHANVNNDIDLEELAREWGLLTERELRSFG